MFFVSLEGFVFKGCHSCVNDVIVPAACAAKSCTFLVGYVLVMGWGLALSISVCRSFVEIVVHLCVLNVWATWPSLLMLQDFSLKYRFQL